MNPPLSTRHPRERLDSALARRRLLALLSLGAAGALAACGKKGPLRLPKPPPSEPPSSSTGSSDEEEP